MSTITESIEVDVSVTTAYNHPDERIAWRSDDGPEHAGVVTFHRLSDATTRVTAQMDIDPEGFVENVADKLGILNRRVKATSRGSRSSSNPAAATRPANGVAMSTARHNPPTLQGKEANEHRRQVRRQG